MNEAVLIQGFLHSRTLFRCQLQLQHANFTGCFERRRLAAASLAVQIFFEAVVRVRMVGMIFWVLVRQVLAHVSRWSELVVAGIIDKDSRTDLRRHGELVVPNGRLEVVLRRHSPWFWNFEDRVCDCIANGIAGAQEIS